MAKNMTTDADFDKKMAALSEKLQRDVDIILEKFLGHTSKNDLLFEDHFDVDAVLSAKISVKEFGNTTKQKNKRRVMTDHTSNAFRGIDAMMDPVDPLFYEYRRVAKKTSLFRKVADAAQNIMGIAF